MNRLVGSVVSLLAFNIFSFGQSKSSDSVILWKENKLLCFEDFKRKPDTTFIVYGSPANGAASLKISLLVDVDSNGNIVAKVLNKFLTHESWIKCQTLHVLQHEQGHFDISEIFARKIRRAFSKLKPEDYKEDILHAEFSKFYNECSAYQDLYDSETHHGFIAEKQKSWLIKIKDELRLLKDYSE